MQLNGIDISGLRGSSSANIQFSRDIYDDEGELQSSGFDIDDKLGASSADVVFVMSPELMNEDTYNCWGTYPTVEKADIQRCCATILAKDPNIQMQIESILKGRNLPIRTMLQEEFDREAVLEELSRGETEKQVEETGAILHSVNGKPIREETGAILKSVNGRDILSSAIEATEGTTRVESMNSQARAIKELARGKDEIEKEFEGNGRVLIRPSGTEPLVRVMLEGKEEGQIKELATNLANLIQDKLSQFLRWTQNNFVFINKRQNLVTRDNG